MSSWGEFAEARPDMMKLLLEILDWIPITYLATVRDDGAPRVHPVCPIIAEGRMFVAVAATSPKRLDPRSRASGVKSMGKRGATMSSTSAASRDLSKTLRPGA
ncbi:MAG: hypothetical protein E6I38_07750 [Chloroflexi bacterium]|nr:MAG: hypothetical protein E6I38_07750 [Chloroflexota bacterium]